MVIEVSGVRDARDAAPCVGAAFRDVYSRDVRGPARRFSHRDARRQVAERARLDEQVAKHRGFLRAREHASAGAVGGELVQQIVACAAADDVDILDVRSPVTASSSSSAAAWLVARLSSMRRATSPCVSGAATPCAAHAAASLRGMSPRPANSGRVEIDREPERRRLGGGSEQRGVRVVVPSCSSHSRRHSSSTHIPARFLRKRTVPSRPASFVNPASRAAALEHRRGSSIPTSDHVPS